MAADIDRLLSASPDPELTGRRLEQLQEDTQARRIIDSLSESLLEDLLCILGSSGFLFNLVSRYPGMLELVGREFELRTEDMKEVKDFDALRRFKYEALLRLTWMDITGRFHYPVILNGLSRLAEAIVQESFRLALPPGKLENVRKWLAVFALGKLGASELNYSSDIDLVCVSANAEDVDAPLEELQSLLMESIRTVSRRIEEKTMDGFLYRVDLKLRPWGSSGPLCMGLDATEHYYEASSEPWERFAWLRSRVIAGSRAIGEELQQRLRPFIFMRSLSTDDLDRFVQIKNEMSRARKRRGHWNVKVGEGGIRDIEFFTQMLQIVNAGRHPELQKTSTLQVLKGLAVTGMLTEEERSELTNSYLFLRRLENRLQMVDERQTHELPDSRRDRLVIARSLRVEGKTDDEILNNFENELFVNQSIAKMYFERVLPQQAGQA